MNSRSLADAQVYWYILKLMTNNAQKEGAGQPANETMALLERVIQVEPYDVATLVALKDAYQKVGDQALVMATSKRLAEAYALDGQTDLASAEYEAIAREAPDDPEIKRGILELKKGGKKAIPQRPATAILRQGGKASEGDKRLGQLLIEEHLLKANEVWSLLHLLSEVNARRNAHELAVPLLLLANARNGIPMEHLLTAVAERSNLPFVPLNLCDLDPEVVHLLPPEITWPYCVVPFDRIGRRTLVATVNPLDEDAEKAVQQALKVDVLWYLAFPTDILSILRETTKTVSDQPKP